MLSGTRVLDLSSVGPAARCARILADYGAAVVKVGPPARKGAVQIEPPFFGYGGGRGMQRVRIDLKSAGGRDAFLRLAAASDVVLESFRPGVAARLGIGLEDVRVRAVLEDRSGAVWFGTHGRGVYRLQAGRLTRFGTANGLSGDAVKAIAQDHLGRMWVGSNIGLDLIENGRIAPPPAALRNLGSFMTSILFEDRRRRMWIATDAFGLLMMDGERLHRYGLADGLPSPRIVSIHEDESGALWFGTLEGLVDDWPIVVAMEGLVGFLMIGWSAAVFVTDMEKVLRRRNIKD